MHPIQLLRKKDPVLRAALDRRPGVIDWDSFDALEIERHQAQMAVEQLRARRREIASAVGKAKLSRDPTFALSAVQLMTEGERLARQLPDLVEQGNALTQQQTAWVQRLPNAPLAAVPDGEDERHNRIVRAVGEPARNGGDDHVAISAAFGGIDAARGAQLAGSRFAVLEGNVARLHRALIQMMLDLHGEAGYREVSVPYLANAATLFGTGQLPKFEDDLFKTQDGLYLIPTAEVPVTNLVAGRTLTMDDLPLAWVAHTPCFRREAGSAGRDVHGLIRQHQFEKVEMVRLEHPAQSEEALEQQVVAGAAAVLDALELPYRVVELCVGDLGFGSQHTFDLEVWVPSQNAYREISSCSNMGEFQARRMGTKLKDGEQLIVPHTLNGSGLAVGRSLVAVLENHLQPDGRLRLPERLAPYFGGRTHLDPVGNKATRRLGR